MDYEIYAIKGRYTWTRECNAGQLKGRIALFSRMGCAITVYSHITHRTYKLA